MLEEDRRSLRGPPRSRLPGRAAGASSHCRNESRGADRRLRSARGTESSARLRLEPGPQVGHRRRPAGVRCPSGPRGRGGRREHARRRGSPCASSSTRGKAERRATHVGAAASRRRGAEAGARPRGRPGSGPGRTAGCDGSPAVTSSSQRTRAIMAPDEAMIDHGGRPRPAARGPRSASRTRASCARNRGDVGGSTSAVPSPGGAPPARCRRGSWAAPATRKAQKSRWSDEEGIVCGRAARRSWPGRRGRAKRGDPRHEA